MTLTRNRLIKTAVLILLFVSTILVLGRNINPFSFEMFMFHDETQAARIQEFTFNIEALQLPPRIAPHFSFNLGYPVFNFYAPFSYWIGSVIHLFHIPIIASIKLSILAAIGIAFSGMFLLVRKYVSFYGGILAAIVYTASPYIAVEIFVRGNIAELWFYALLPWALYALVTNEKKRILFTSLILSFLFTSHNVLSLVSILIVLLFSLLLKKKRLNVLSIALGLLLSSYFLIPFFAEMNWVPASEVATITNYRDHFLCIKQLWSSPWGFAGSAPGCEADGISFMLGKANILLGIAGLFIATVTILKKKMLLQSKELIYIALLSIGSAFMVTSSSAAIWHLTEPVSSVFQFPWRLLIFVLFGLAFFSGWSLQFIPKKLILIAVFILSIGILYTNHEYFYGNTISNTEYSNRFLSPIYIRNSVAYKIAEYLPVSADYNYWRSVEDIPETVDAGLPVVQKGNQVVQVNENKAFSKRISVQSSDSYTTLNIHYAPYWHIFTNGTRLIPSQFDKLGRPIISISDKTLDEVIIEYKQTPIEQIANIFSLVSVIALSLYTVFQFNPTWKNTTTKKH